MEFFLLSAMLVIAFLLWGIPAVRCLYHRLALLMRLLLLRRRRDVYFTFRSPLSLFAFNRGKHADLLTVCGRDAYIVKRGGSFQRAAQIVATSPQS